MTEATQRPWDVEFAATKSYDLIYSGSRMDSTTIARVPWTGKSEDRANTELIVKAVNSHDALVAALNDALHIVHVSSDATDLHDALKDWAHSVECDVLPALDQVK
jgi:hypothetical protein